MESAIALNKLRGAILLELVSKQLKIANHHKTCKQSESVERSKKKTSTKNQGIGKFLNFWKWQG